MGLRADHEILDFFEKNRGDLCCIWTETGKAWTIYQRSNPGTVANGPTLREAVSAFITVLYAPKEVREEAKRCLL